VIAELHASLRAGRNLTFEEAHALSETLLAGAVSDQEAADVLVQLALKGETAVEVQAFVTSLLSHAEAIPFDEPTVDTCGTGGSGLVRFNVSTAAAFVLAAGGVCIAKHGNRGSLRPNGSFDLLDALGVRIDLDGPAVATCLSQTGLGFIYARRFHPAMRRVAAARQLAGRRTIFNLAGPLSNPTRVRAQVVGAATRADAITVAKCLYLLGRQQGFSVTGNSGIDDVDLSGPSALYAADANATFSELDPTALGLVAAPYSDLPGGDAATNAEMFRRLLHGQAPPALRVVVCLSAALAFFAAERTESVSSGLSLAAQLLASGAVREKFTQYRDVAASLGHL
jgi:anthranilate phosphoribosyltransferase